MGAVAIGSFLLLLVVAYLIARPLFAPEVPVEETEGSKLLEDKQKLLAEIRELDMDFATGKLTEDDYRKLRARTMAEAAATIQAIAESADLAPGAPGESGEEAGPDLGTARGDGRVSASLEDALEREIATRKQALEERGCPGCGAVNDPRIRFCRLCGTQLATAETG